MLFRRGDLVQRLLKLPDDEELQTQLSSRYIKREVAVLNRVSAASAAPSADTAPSVEGRVGALVLQRVKAANIYITIVNGGNGDDSSLITAQGQ